MEQVREEARVSAGLMYRYFPSKDDMLRAAISGSMLQFEAIITESFARQLESYRSAARRWTTRAKSEAAAQAIAAAVVGYVVQSAFSDTEIDVARYCNGLTALA